MTSFRVQPPQGERARAWDAEQAAKLAILLGSLLAAAVGIAVLLTTRPLEPDST